MKKTISFVGKFCEKRGVKLPIPFEEALVNMQVQSLERTFIDKVFAICDYRLQDMQDRDSRHLYDIAKLLGIFALLFVSGVVIMLLSVHNLFWIEEVRRLMN